MSGTVTRKSVEVESNGAARTGSDDDHHARCLGTANFKETELADVKPGQKAEIHVDMYGKSVFGHVDSIADSTGRHESAPPENATGNFVKVVSGSG